MALYEEEGTSIQSAEFYAEQEGRQYVQNIFNAFEKEPWGLTLLQLAWTAGPLTFIALQGGYLLGYGKTAPFNLFIYFAFYTLIAGALGFLVKVIHSALATKQSEALQKSFLLCNDMLFRSYKGVVNLRLSALPLDERKIESAVILLSNTHASPSSIALGVKELINDEELMATIKTIETFRRSGLFSRVNDEISLSSTLRRSDVVNLINTPNEAGYYLKIRLQGGAPSLQDGMSREDGFLQRINQASESYEPHKVTLKDVEEFLLLLYELLNGRKIDLLSFSYSKNKKLRTAARTLEKSRALFRQSKASLMSHIDSLYSDLVGKNLIEDVKNYDSRYKYEQLYEAVNKLAIELLDNLNQKREPSYRDSRDFFIKVSHKHQLLNRLYTRAIYRQESLEKAINQWQSISQKLNASTTHVTLKQSKRGLFVKQRTICLYNKQKLELSDIIAETVQKLSSLLSIDASSNLDAIKKEVINVYRSLDNLIHISSPVVQYGIESSKATNFGSMDLDSSIEARILWATSMVAETENNLSHAAEKLAKVLVFEYQEQLDEKSMIFLNQKYGAQISNLCKIVEEKNNALFRPTVDIPVHICKQPIQWRHVINKTR